MATRLDVEAFIRVLRERYPTIRFFEAEKEDGRLFNWREVQNPADRAAENTVWATIPGERWNPKALQTGTASSPDLLSNRTFWFNGRYRTYTYALASGGSVENLSWSTLSANYWKSDIEAARFLRVVWRICDKLSARHVKLIDCETGATRDPRTTGGYIRLGLDALRWCQERDDRVLNYDVRPTDDWAMPDLPYYD